MDEQQPPPPPFPPSKADAIILALGIVGGMWSRFSAHKAYLASARYYQETPGQVLALGFVMGLAWSGPAIFIVQRSRGRLASLRPGERLWLVSAPMVSAVIWTVMMIPVLFPLLFLGLAVQTLLSVAAFFTLFFRRSAWTETVDCLSCMLTGAAYWFAVAP